MLQPFFFLPVKSAATKTQNVRPGRIFQARAELQRLIAIADGVVTMAQA